MNFQLLKQIPKDKTLEDEDVLPIKRPRKAQGEYELMKKETLPGPNSVWIYYKYVNRQN